MAKINDEQFLYAELTETLRFAELEEIQAASENEKSISKTLSETQIPERGAAISQQRIKGFRRCGGLSEY